MNEDLGMLTKREPDGLEWKNWNWNIYSVLLVIALGVVFLFFLLG